MALQVPWEAFFEAQKMKNQNQQNMYQNIAGLGQGLGEGIGAVGQAIQEQQRKKALLKLLQQIQNQNQPQQPSVPPTQSMGTIPPGQPMTAGLGNVGQDVTMTAPPPQKPVAQSPMGGSSQPFNGVDPSQLMKALGPDTVAEILKAQLAPNRYGQKGQASKPTGSIFRNSATGEMTDDPVKANGPEWKEYKTTQGDILNKLAGQTSGKARNESMGARAEAMQRGIDARQIDRLAQTVGVTSAQRNLLQQNNMRANRAIELASKPMTWQEFGAVTTDAAAIMQGGAPQVQQLHDMSYPSWKQDLARAQTFISSTPTANVPDEFKNRIIGMIKGVQQVDNRYLKKNAEFMQKMLAPTIRGGIDQFKAPIADMTNTITESGGGAQPYSDPGKEARYQAWKKSQGQ